MNKKFKGSMLRFIIEYFVPVFISVFLNIRFLSFEEAFDYLSLIASLAFSILMIGIPSYFGFKLYKNRAHLEDPEVIERYDVLYDGLKTTSPLALLANQVFMLRRLLMVIVLVFLHF